MVDVMNKATESSSHQNPQVIIQECSRLKKIYFQEAMPPSSHEVYNNAFVENILRILERVNSNNQLAN